MKPVHFLLPSVAIFIAGYWLGPQKREIYRLEQESALLRTHVQAAARSEKDREENHPGRTQITKGKIDWLEIAGRLEEEAEQGGLMAMRDRLAFQTAVKNMSKDELLAVLDEIRELEMAEHIQADIQSYLIMALTKIDPELVLSRFSDDLGNERFGMNRSLANAFGAWTKKDPVAAAEWLDQKVAEGAIVSKSLREGNQPWLRFETELTRHLFAEDLPMVEARLANLSARDKLQVLRGVGMNRMSEHEQIAYAKLVREQLPEDESLGALIRQASVVSSIGHVGLKKVSAYLDRIDSSGEERAGIAEQMVRQSFPDEVTKDSIDSLRDWLHTEAPGSVDRVTGESLGRAVMMETMGYADAEEYVLKYYESTGNDEILVSFLTSSSFTERNRPGARALAEKIADPALRRALLGRLEMRNDSTN